MKQLTKVTCLKDGVELTPDVRGHFCEGKKALTEGKDQIRAQYDRKISGSLNIDSVTKEFYPQDNRWDYVVEYNGILHYIEVHSAYGKGRIDEIQQKKKWLHSWLKNHAPHINKLSPTPILHWVATGKIDLGNDINKNSVQWRRLSIPNPVKSLLLQ